MCRVDNGNFVILMGLGSSVIEGNTIKFNQGFSILQLDGCIY